MSLIAVKALKYGSKIKIIVTWYCSIYQAFNISQKPIRDFSKNGEYSNSWRNVAFSTKCQQVATQPIFT